MLPRACNGFFASLLSPPGITGCFTGLRTWRLPLAGSPTVLAELKNALAACCTLANAVSQYINQLAVQLRSQWRLILVLRSDARLLQHLRFVFGSPDTKATEMGKDESGHFVGFRDVDMNDVEAMRHATMQQYFRSPRTRWVYEATTEAQRGAVIAKIFNGYWCAHTQSTHAPVQCTT